jgi:hypothetical protein
MASHRVTNVGDKVAYTRAFCKSIQAPYEIWQARGTVTGISEYGSKASPFTLVSITWDNGADMPDRVNAHNICRLKSVAFVD